MTANDSARWQVISESIVTAILLCVICSELLAENGPGLTFSDVTREAGTGGPTEPNRLGGHGAMWADVDFDGRPDLYITMIFTDPMPELFFRNLGGGRFADEGRPRGVADFDGGSHGACFADLDNDGDYDLFNGTTWNHRKYPCFNNVFRNDGSGHSEDATKASGIPMDRRRATRGVLTFDMDGDGDLDLFCVTNYQGSKDPPDEVNELYRNDGGLRFTAIDDNPALTAPCGQGATDTDFDGDGDIDIIAANRTGLVNVLRNDGRGQFELRPPESIGVRHRATDGITMGDVDNDGDLDLLLAGNDVGHLYANDGHGRFSFRQTFSQTDGYMAGCADLDNDGDLDVVFAGDDHCYLNDGTGRFDAGPTIPVAGINDPRGLAFADYDSDGDLDFAIVCKRSRNWLVRNNLNSGNWLRVKLISPNGQAGAFSAKVRVRPLGDGTARLIGMREARSSNGYLAQNDPVLHFGLANHKFVDVEVRFLDGSVATRSNVAAGQTVTIDPSRQTNVSIDVDDTLDHTGTRWAPFLEWSLQNKSVEGNPFDVTASVKFTHAETEAQHTTEMFFTGDRTWKFRFTGTRVGLWDFVTTSADSELDGHKGRVLIRPNDSAHGFVTHVGNKWARPYGKDGELRAFAPQLVMYGHPATFHGESKQIDTDIVTFIREHGFTGFHVPVFCRWFDIDHDRSSDIRSDDPNPDPRTFEALEQLITKAHAAGGVVHFWAWGDESRHQTPARWGINGKVDQRLQRYIAARLGPLPGWTMGYGFDLDEWVNERQIGQWRDYVHSHLGWSHMLGGRHGDPNRGLDHSPAVSWNRRLDYSSYEHHRPTFDVYQASLQAVAKQPVFSEDRFRIRRLGRYRDKDYTEEMTRRGLWRSTMAGGVANIWGRLDDDLAINAGNGASLPYDHPEWIRTWADFFNDRFTLGIEPAADLTDGHCLRHPAGEHYVFYRESVTAIRMDLSMMNGDRSAIAVDTRRAYNEIDLGELPTKTQTWTAPYQSDWAIAVGNFDAVND